MTSFNDIIRGRLTVAKDVTVGDVHVSTAIGNSGASQLPFPRMPHPRLDSHGVPEDDADRKRKKKRPHAFVGHDRKVRTVVPEELGPGANAEDGFDGVTVKRYGSTKDLPDVVRGKLKGKKRRRWLHVFNSSLGTHDDESRAFAEAWSTVKKREPRSLFIQRPLINGHSLRQWALEQGFKTTLRPEDMHVTLAWCKEPVDWDSIGEPQTWSVTTPAVTGSVGSLNNARFVGPLGSDGAIVLRFDDPVLQSRNEDLAALGASWPHGNFKPHITISYGDMPTSVEPYIGLLAFGPEEWSEADSNWRPNYVEKKTKKRLKKSDALSGEPMVGVGGRRLEPFDAGTFFVPMKYDPSALSYLRNDQVPRFLDAITHPDELKVVSLPIAELVAVKGRVSRETIQKHLDRMAEEKSLLGGGHPDSRIEGVDDLDPPVVVFMNGTFYLVDGHDRAVAMWLDGIDVVDVAFSNIEAYDNTKPDPDDSHRNTAHALLQGVDGRTLTNYVDGTLAVPFMADLQFFSHLRPDQVPKFTYAVTHPDKLSDAKVALASLVAIQNRVNANTVAAKVEKGWRKPPVIVRMNDVNYIADGHDRLAASWLRGDDEVPVKLTDITWADNSMRPSDLVKSTVADRARAKERLEAAEGLVKSVSVRVDEVNRRLVERQAEADRLRAEVDRYEVEKRGAVERFEAEKRAEVERFEVERLSATTEKVAEAEHALKVKRLKVKRKLESADDYVEEMARQRKRLDRHVADQQESVDRQVAKIQHELERKVQEEEERASELLKEAERKNRIADRRLEETQGGIDEVLKEAERKEREADRRLARAKEEAEQASADVLKEIARKNRKADRRLARAREEAEEASADVLKEIARKNREVDRRLEEAQGGINEVLKEAERKEREADRRLAMAKEEAERAASDVVKELARKNHEVDLKLQEADRYVEHVVKARRKAKRKLEIAVEKADTYSERTRGDADRYLAEKRLEADRYDVEKRSAANQYDVEKRTDADRYAVAKRQETDDSVFERKRELNRMELGQLDEIQNRATTELSARQIAKIQVLKKQLKTGTRQLKVDVQKVDQEKRQIFGWASVVTKNGETVWDKQGDAIPVEELEEAVYNYMLQSRDGSNMHVVKGVSRCIESMMWTTEKATAMGVPLPDGIQGWWTGFICDDDELWNAVKKGELLEFSIGGQAVSTKVED